MIIVGISGALGHDSAACLIRDGTPVAMAEEERFVRIKRASKLPPVRAMLYCLAEAGIDFQEVDLIATAWDPSLDEGTPLLRDFLKDLKRHEVFRDRKFPPIVHVDHHLAHAAASYYPSGFDNAAILVTDGQGERVATTIAHGKGRTINAIRSYDVSQSIGYFYSAITHYIGLGTANAGKTMGLAPYGRPEYEFSKIRLTADGYQMDIKRPADLPPGLWHAEIRSQWLDWLSETFGPRNMLRFGLDPTRGRVTRDYTLEGHFKDMAASAQNTLDRLLSHLAGIVVRQTGSRNLVLGGGVALNCTANGAIRQSGLVDDLYIFPAAHDAGGALGAALTVAAQHGEPPCPPINHAYWGPEFDEATIAAVLKQAELVATEHPDIGDKAAELLCHGATIGWFQGRMEVGPRALGHRSILADPTKLQSLNHVNRNVKGREHWRPLAPSMLDETAQRMLEGYRPSPFMLQAFQVRHEGREHVRAVTHVDGSTRPQTMTSAVSPQYQRLLESMKRYSGIGAVLNTSFNSSDEPIVCTPSDAIRTYFSTGLDALIMGHFLLQKPARTPK